MTHRFFVSVDQVRGESVTFSAEQSRQIRSVLRLRPGDTVRVFDGVIAEDQLIVLDGPTSGHIEASCPQPPEPRTTLIAYPALLQRDKFETVLQKLTEIGVAAVGPVLAARSLVREAPDQHRQTRWRAIMREASEQCGRGVLPELLPAMPFGEAIQRASARATSLMAHQAERRRSVKDALDGADQRVAMFVGPEGGFESSEVDCARQAGARLVSLGPRILRAETASPLLAALVLHERGDLSSADDEHPSIRANYRS